MTTPIKFCGLTRVEDVVFAAGLGVDYIGLVLTASPRRIGLDQAAALAGVVRDRAAPPRIVLLFRDDPAALVEDAIARIGPDLLQFHGAESDAFCARFGQPHWKAIAMAGRGDEVRVEAGRHPSARALLLDGHAAGAAGGGGQRFDWSRWPDLDRPLVLAGGLDADNVAVAIAATRPFAVDVSSGIEQGTAGIKDPGRMRAFVAAVRSVT